VILFNQLTMRVSGKTICCWAFAVVVAYCAVGCSHTQPMVSPAALRGAGASYRVGISGVYDLNQFDYAPVILDETAKMKVFSDTALTHDLSDTDFDYVIRGNFAYYKVPSKNGFHIFSIYCLWLPLLSGLPNTHIDGRADINFEIYHKGQLLKTYEYNDIFWAERSYLTLWPEPSLEMELRRLARLLLRDMSRDFFGHGVSL
ncbi:MAG TPA: hypothetical protein PKK36_11615, partial [Kiritimatiellia bacterium]|nr:hypothetical protein [Kiritimatiellia bacterium]